MPCNSNPKAATSSLKGTIANCTYAGLQAHVCHFVLIDVLRHVPIARIPMPFFKNAPSSNVVLDRMTCIYVAKRTAAEQRQPDVP